MIDTFCGGLPTMYRRKTLQEFHFFDKFNSTMKHPYHMPHHTLGLVRSPLPSSEEGAIHDACYATDI